MFIIPLLVTSEKASELADLKAHTSAFSKYAILDPLLRKKFPGQVIDPADIDVYDAANWFHYTEYLDRLLRSPRDSEMFINTMRTALDDTRRKDLSVEELSDVLTKRYMPAVQAGMTALDVAITNKTIVGSVLGGGHHAERRYGDGFCVFNDAGIITNYALVNDLAERVLYIDGDIHNGDQVAFQYVMQGVSWHQWKGTRAEGHDFGDRIRCFDICQEGYPDLKYPHGFFRIFASTKGKADFIPYKASFNDAKAIVKPLIDVTDKDYLDVMRQVKAYIALYEPDLIIYNASQDPVGALSKLKSLTREMLRERDKIVFEVAGEQKIPVVVLFGSGYASKKSEEAFDAGITGIVNGHMATAEEMLNARETYYNKVG